MADDPVRNILSRLEQANRGKAAARRSDGRNWDTLCPVHADRRASLSVGLGDDGCCVLHCQRGCTTESILAALGLSLRDLYPANGEGGTRSRIVATYDYKDEAGCLLYQAVRYEPKAFRQRRPKTAHPRRDRSDDWHWNLEGVRRVLYRLPELLASPADATIFVVEGEKDADRLAGLGLVATTNAAGAGKWRKDYAAFLKGRGVVILPDNDAPGKAHALQVRQSLEGVAAWVRVVELPGLADKGDVSDWLAGGGTKERLLELAGPPAPPPLTPAAPSEDGGEWDAPVPLGDSAEVIEPFPLEVFPPPLATFFRGVAEAIGCPVDYPAVIGLAVATGAVGALYAVDVKEDYVEPVSLYVCVVAPKGSKKTPALKAVAKPLYREHARRHAAGDEDSPAFVSDVTVEKLAALLHNNQRGSIVIRDESSAWMKSMDQYKAKGSGSDRQFWLSVNSCDPINVYRKDPDRPPVFVAHPCVTVLGGIQPKVLARLTGDDDGFYDRILFSYPDPLPARGETWATVPKSGARLWESMILKILRSPMCADENGSRPHFLKLNAKARRVWEEWTSSVAGHLNDPEYPEYLKGPATKLTGYAARMAGVVHALREFSDLSEVMEIEADDMTAGAALGAYFLSHAGKVYRAMGRDPRVADAQRLLTWLGRWGKPSFSRRDAWRALRKSFAQPEDLAGPLKLLSAHGFIRWREPVDGARANHTSTYDVNPALPKATTEAADTADEGRADP